MYYRNRCDIRVVLRSKIGDAPSPKRRCCRLRSKPATRCRRSPSEAARPMHALCLRQNALLGRRRKHRVCADIFPFCRHTAWRQFFFARVDSCAVNATLQYRTCFHITAQSNLSLLILSAIHLVIFMFVSKTSRYLSCSENHAVAIS